VSWVRSGQITKFWDGKVYINCYDHLDLEAWCWMTIHTGWPAPPQISGINSFLPGGHEGRHVQFQGKGHICGDLPPQLGWVFKSLQKLWKEGRSEQTEKIKWQSVGKLEETPSRVLLWEFIYIFETGSHYVGQAGFTLMILPPQLPEFWDYRSAPPHLLSNF
jgi:hypothetical protein